MDEVTVAEFGRSLSKQQGCEAEFVVRCCKRYGVALDAVLRI